jgi:hypothetical protein
VLRAYSKNNLKGNWKQSIKTAKIPGVVEDRMEPWEYLNVTLDFDHDIVDGAPAARIAQRCRDQVERGSGLSAQKNARMGVNP